MPPGFGLLDTALVSVPVFLLLLGLIRGAPVELASCCGCVAGVMAAWLGSCLAPVQMLGEPAAPLAALAAGIIVWQLARFLSHRYGFDTRWVEFGRLFDSFAGGVMGGVRGLALMSAACLSYAVIAVPLGLPNPMQTVAYPVFLTMGSRVTHAAVAAAEPVAVALAEATPLPFAVPASAAPVAAPVPLPVSPTSNGPALAALIHVIAPAAAQPVPQPLPAYRVETPIRGVPVSLIETHHNILHPFGLNRRRAHR